MTSVINSIIDGVASVILAVVNLLPQSPFAFDFSTIDKSYLKFFLWIVPVDGMLSILVAYTGSVAIYYGIRVVLRWVKVAGE